MPDQARPVPAVIQVGMRDRHRVDVGGVGRKHLPVAAAQVCETLEEAAADQDPGVTALPSFAGGRLLPP
ncbi:hypothetical protein WKI68_05305 [Streptomyces sp. MS1.HAVA.3]|uniref:Uncharacterized protein n=1 Tax=Streptomyces caledonius TaxID=3134107 RepID=A0ABU8TZI8_9ACTN